MKKMAFTSAKTKAQTSCVVLVGKPEDRFSHDAAQIIMKIKDDMKIHCLLP